MKLKIAFFLTHNISLEDWKKFKILSREIELYKKHLKIGNEVKIISYGDKKDKKILNEKKIKVFPIFRNKIFRSKIFKLSYSIFYIFNNYKLFDDCNVIKTNQVLGSHLAIILKILIKKKLIIRLGYEPYLQNKDYIGFSLKNFLLKYYCKFCYKFADHILISTKQLKNEIIKTYKISNKKISIFPNFIDTEKFKNFNLKKKKNFFTISRFDKQKNLKFLFQEVSNINEKLYFYGPKKDKDVYLNFAKKINANIRYLGPKENSKLPNEINKYNYFVLLSHVEGNPKALLEAMSCERIVIASNVNGIKNILLNNKNGFIFDLKKDNLKKIILNMKKYDLRKIKKNARKYVVKNHDLSVLVNREHELYNRIIT